MKKIPGMLFAILLVSLLVSPPTVAQGDEAGEAGQAAQRPEPGDLRQAMQRMFENRLRSELALSDEQVAAILPRVQEMEESRTRARRERQLTIRELRAGLERGATDTQLAAALDKLERIEREQRELERSVLSGIDGSLSVRQQVQLRFFVEEFRREMQKRVREFRGARGRAEGRRGGPAQGPAARRRP